MALSGLIENDYGAWLEVTIKENNAAVDISSYSTRSLKFISPSGKAKTKTATFKTDGKDGVLAYTFGSGDLDEAGRWRLQVYLAKTNAQVSSLPVTFEVGQRLA